MRCGGKCVLAWIWNRLSANFVRRLWRNDESTIRWKSYKTRLSTLERQFCSRRLMNLLFKTELFAKILQSFLAECRNEPLFQRWQIKSNQIYDYNVFPTLSLSLSLQPCNLPAKIWWIVYRISMNQSGPAMSRYRLKHKTWKASGRSTVVKSTIKWRFHWAPI